MPSEKSITNAIIKELKAREFWTFKVHGSSFQRPGIPDILACKDGRLYAFEVKTARGRVSKLQEHEMEKMRSVGATVGVVRSVEDVDTLIGKEMGV